MSSGPTDAVLLNMMADSRLLSTMPILESLLREKMQWLVNLPMGVWDNIGKVCQEAGACVRDRCIRAAHVSVAYFQHGALDK
eukprot:1255476-Alexandrium_andersonii.AAC.1